LPGDDVPVTRLVSLVVALGCALALAVAPAHAAGDDWVVKAQKRLNSLGCQAGPPDGELGQWTRSAVVRFQSRQGMWQSGHLDDRTRQALYAEGRDEAGRCDQRPVPAASGHGRRIVISQKQNWVWLIGPEGRTVAQGGMVDNPGVLKPGAHGVGSYCGRAARIKLNSSASGNVWLDNFVRFAPCGIGFHRIPRYKTNGKQIHADWILGTDLAESHGCIRLSRQLSRTVWDFTTRRTPVRVV
jgi:peptidoglycan hydrolase-like protein with peptidoglycan-binding domain